MINHASGITYLWNTEDNKCVTYVCFEGADCQMEKKE